MNKRTKENIYLVASILFGLLIGILFFYSYSSMSLDKQERLRLILMLGE